MKNSTMRDIDERTNLAGNSMFELLLFRLGEAPGTDRREMFGINVFKVREILVMPEITAMVNSPPSVMGVANIRGQMISVINLPQIVGTNPTKGLGILLVTEFARTTQAFAVEEVNEIVRLEWKHVLSAEGRGGGLVTSIARLDGAAENTRLAQVLDVEQILRDVFPEQHQLEIETESKLRLPPGTVVLAADDSAVARMMIEQGLKSMEVPYIMTKSGQEAWDRLKAMAAEAESQGKTIRDKVALVLTDLEMPEMDGFTLTRNIKQDARLSGIPVVIHSSLTGTTNEEHVRKVGADAYVAKFVAEELALTLKKVLSRY
ncbi:chemotaxis protein [Rhodoferax sp.]|jgi:two-component system chemotaxis response regulator CheV|uniref:chemotaxis protein n=1 Tax=Rhodoferax sp. TaxID=50421 RepID=UPI0025E82833|nr:chemotaxis protein [Rhodoferax sp.]